MKLLKRIIEAAFLMASSIMLLASDNVWCWIAAIVPFAVFLLLIVAWEEDVCDELYLR